MGQFETLVKQIQEPLAEFTPVPFWFFNDEPDEEKIAAQLADYVDKGVNAIVLHPRIGVPKTLKYLSEDYFKAIRFIVKTAHALDMKIVLYDEGMYPSGSAHGMVVNENPDYAAKGICILDEKTPMLSEGKTIVRFEDGSRLVYCFTHGTFVDVSFWNPHKFQIGSFLKSGINSITLVVTGNAANIYSTPNLANENTDEVVPYGLLLK